VKEGLWQYFVIRSADEVVHTPTWYTAVDESPGKEIIKLFILDNDY